MVALLAGQLRWHGLGYGREWHHDSSLQADNVSLMYAVILTINESIHDIDIELLSRLLLLLLLLFDLFDGP